MSLSWRGSTGHLSFSTALESELYRFRMTKPYRVFVVADREYGQGLTGLTQVGPVWSVDTPANRAVAGQIWDAERPPIHLQGITTFKCPEDGSPEDILINELDTIDRHHGQYSTDLPTRYST